MMAWHDNHDEQKHPGRLAAAMSVLEWLVVAATAVASVVLPAAIVALTSTTSFLSALAISATGAALLALIFLLARRR
jgi:uncharacterized membrane-anchored protein